MESSARLFHCARCRRQVVICRRCDRGQIYCGKRCSQPARRESRRGAGRRYQGSRAGRLKHAERQRRYRQRCREKVTHQGSPARPASDSLGSDSRRRADKPNPVSPPHTTHTICHFCGRLCSPFVRLDFLRGRPRLEHKPSHWRQP